MMSLNQAQNQIVDKLGSSHSVSDEEFYTSCEIEIEEISPVERRVKVKIPESILRQEYKSTMDMTKTEVTLPGFRKGRVPPRVIEKRFGDGLRKEFLEGNLRRTVEAVVTRNNYRVLGEPVYEPRDLAMPKEGPLSFMLIIEIVPEVPLPDLASISLVRPKFEITDERINNAMNHLRRSMGVMQPETGPIEKGDQTFIEGEITQADGTMVLKMDYSRVSEGGFISGVEVPGLDELLLGKSTGDSIEMTFKARPDSEKSIPHDVDMTLKGEIIHNSRLALPALDDEFVKSNGFESLEDLHTQMREAMESRMNLQSQEAVRSQLMESLENAMAFPLPSQYFSRHLKVLFESQIKRFADAGVSFDQLKSKSDMLAQALAPQAQVNCHRDIILQRVSNGEEPEVTREEVMDRLLELSQQAGENLDRFAERARHTGLVDGIAMEIRQAHVLDGLITSCNVREISEDEWKAMLDEKATKMKAAREEAEAQAKAAAEKPLTDATTTAVPAAEPSVSDAT